jgi:septum formation protein
MINNWMNPDHRLLLASGSPRRKQILAQMGFSFDVITPDNIDESSYLVKNDLCESIQHLASVKAEGISKRNPDALVLGADTIVVRSNKVLEKPKDYNDAFEMLKMLSNGRHTVITGVALLCIQEKFLGTTVSCTDVSFRHISDQEIHDYLQLQEYTDKAGAYAIQGRAMVFVDKISGCYYNVVGLPVTSTINLFKDFYARKESADV